MDRAALDQLAEEFAKWRETRSSKRARIPKAMLNRARGLSPGIPEIEICRRISFPRRRLFPKKQERAQFIELPAVAAEPAMIEVEVRQGVRTLTLRLPAATPLTALLPLLQS